MKSFAQMLMPSKASESKIENNFKIRKPKQNDVKEEKFSKILKEKTETIEEKKEVKPKKTEDKKLEKKEEPKKEETEKVKKDKKEVKSEKTKDKKEVKNQSEKLKGKKVEVLKDKTLEKVTGNKKLDKSKMKLAKEVLANEKKPKQLKGLVALDLGNKKLLSTKKNSDLGKEKLSKVKIEKKVSLVDIKEKVKIKDTKNTKSKVLLKGKNDLEEIPDAKKVSKLVLIQENPIKEKKVETKTKKIETLKVQNLSQKPAIKTKGIETSLAKVGSLKNPNLKKETLKTNKSKKTLVKRRPELNTKTLKISDEKDINLDGKKMKLNLDSLVEVENNFKDKKAPIKFSRININTMGILKNKDESNNLKIKENVSIEKYGFKKIKKSSNNTKEIIGNTIKLDTTQNAFKLGKTQLVNTTPRVSFEDYDVIMKQVESGMKMKFDTDVKEMKIRLHPEELGEIQVKLKLTDNVMKAEFLVTNDKVKEVLESRFNELRANLFEKGIDATEINVSISNGESNQEQQEFYQDKQKFVERKVLDDEVKSNVSSALLENNNQYISKDKKRLNILV